MKGRVETDDGRRFVLSLLGLLYFYGMVIHEHLTHASDSYWHHQNLLSSKYTRCI
jgi:hypothetical protein